MADDRCPRCYAEPGTPCLDAQLLDRARNEVMEIMGWEDDRYGVAVEYQGSCWDTATEIAAAVLRIAQAPGGSS